MEDDKGLHVVAFDQVPRLENGSYDKEKIKLRYLESPHIDFRIFCNSVKWDYFNITKDCETVKWKVEKKNLLAQQAAEKLGSAIFDHKLQWHAEVLQTLKDYPKAYETQLHIVKFAQQEMLLIMREYQEARQRGDKEKLKELGPFFKRIRTMDIVNLTYALDRVQAGKYRSLLLDQWTIKKAEETTVAEEFVDTEDGGAARPDADWKITLVGGDTLESQDVRRLINSWFDPAHSTRSDESQGNSGITESKKENE